MPVIILRSPTDGWREGVRNRFLRGTLKALRLAGAYIVGTEWLKRAQLVHILDHSYAHMVTRVQRRPAVVTVHDLMPVIILRSPTDGWREGVRNRFLRG